MSPSEPTDTAAPEPTPASVADLEATAGSPGPLLEHLAREADRFFRDIRSLPTSREVAPEKIRRILGRRYRFDEPVEPEALLDDMVRMLRDWTVHVTHPRYFGLFNPSVRPISVAADALVALANPQLATWTHAPAAHEIERHVLRYFSERIGWEPDAAAGQFVSGGQEANHTAAILALVDRFPGFADSGLRSLPGQPVLYLSEQGHHSVEKITVATGLGRGSLRLVPTDESFRLDVGALASAVEGDRRAGHLPFLVVATAGTTSAGAIDPLPDLAALARRESLWLHADAAWGGSALLSRRLAPALAGLGEADSVTWDAHKGLSVPMGAGMLFTRHPEALEQAFASATGYMPSRREGTVDPYATSLQWSRRFIGLKVFMALAEAGASGVEHLLDHQAAMGELLRERLRGRGFEILNRTPLPLVCFTHPALEAGTDTPGRLAKRVAQRGRAWLSAVGLPGGRQALRACITSYRTGPEDVDVLVAEVERELGSTHSSGGS